MITTMMNVHRFNSSNSIQFLWIGMRITLMSIFLFFVVLSSSTPTDAFQIVHLKQHREHNSRSFLQMAAGMGMATSGKKKEKNNKKNDTNSGSSKGMGKTQSNPSASSSEQPFNVNSSMSRLEKKYDELMRAAAKNLASRTDDDDDDDDDSYTLVINDDDIITTEYVVATRAIGYVDDWVPIAQMCLARSYQQNESIDKQLRIAAISYYRRELSHAATIGSKKFQSVPRNLLQYSIEHIDSFQKHVYDNAVRPSSSTSSSTDSNGLQNKMSKEDARVLLNLHENDDDNTQGTEPPINGGVTDTPSTRVNTNTNNNVLVVDDLSRVKRQYRKLSFEWHPDRFVGKEEEEIQAANEQFMRIRLAYETLNSGIRNGSSSTSTTVTSWYESLGGRSRTDFSGPIQLLTLDGSKTIMEQYQLQSALCGLDPQLVQSFVTRCSQQ